LNRKPSHLEIRFQSDPAWRGEDLEAVLGEAFRSRIRSATLALHSTPITGAAADQVRSLLGRLPATSRIHVRASDAAFADGVSALRALKHSGGARVALDFVLGADANAFAAFGPKPGRLARVGDLSRAARVELGLPVRWLVPAIPALVHRLEAIFSLAQDEGVTPLLVPQWMLAGSSQVVEPALEEEERLFLQDFITYRLLAPGVGASYPAYYRRLLSFVGDPESGRGAAEAVVVLEGGVQASGVRWRMGRGSRPAFDLVLNSESAGEFDRGWLRKGLAAGGDLGEVLGDGIRAWLRWAGNAMAGRTRPAPLTEGLELPRVLAMGAYGGDHIGDAAILGGVLLRMHRRYRTRSAVLVSQRPAHSRRLMAMLDLPVDITVEEYTLPNARRILDRVDGVVFAGGPLMDLPKQLVKHFYTAGEARRRGKPLIVEGIGAGPFIRRPSLWIGRRLVRMAREVSVRTSDDLASELLRGNDAVLGRDPAFDYLESRPRRLTRVAQADRGWVDRLTGDAEGRTLVGINLRPIRSEFAAGVAGGDRARRTRQVEGLFEERLAKGMADFHEASAAPPVFVFFPMNAIQFGSSDLRSAYRLRRLLGSGIDMRVWEGDPGIDGVFSLLRRVDLVISMRFHATIYALAAGCRVIGIDYRIGKRDKVAALLGDFGMSENCSRIDEMTSDWLFGRLSRLATIADSPRSGT
jgi:polysaccharide pyruvyl transferase WcaK-like protein